ncbi:uncharacterized protein LOC129234161 [Uloborus diversus]|uniref:uncharacterized protein LOC129234161 n=1 Tax=Uloborus diversus TaxID=327109 RepID=UPI002409F193|nr:uncharacterized protein LOC129234161 [Uloborus diversus]
MRYMDAANTMVPVPACSSVSVSNDASCGKPMLSLALPSFDAIAKKKNDFSVFGNGLLNSSYSVFKPWSTAGKKHNSTQNVGERDKSSLGVSESAITFCPSERNLSSKQHSFINERNKNDWSENDLGVTDYKDVLPPMHFPGILSGLPMNGAEKLNMTGSTNPRAEHLSWLSEVASAASKGTLNRHVSSPEQSQAAISSAPTLHSVAENTSQILLPNAGSLFSPQVVIARPANSNNVKMFTPPFQIERTRHVQHSSIPVAGTTTALYYTQAPRNSVYPSFFQATYSSPSSYSAPATQSVATNVPINNEPTRTYLQVDNYSNLPIVHSVGSTTQLPCSPGYLQSPHSTASPTNLTVPSPHNRLFQQGRSILISRSPEVMITQQSLEREPCHVRIQLSPTVPLLQEDPSRRKSYTSIDSVMGSSSCSPVIETGGNVSHASDFAVSKEYVNQQTTPSSNTSYRLPTGKEGSLKHRILRPPSINIVDPPQSIVADAPLSAPPIRTHREPSPKQARSIPSSGYRSFSSSASSITEVSTRIPSVSASPCGTFLNHRSSLSSGSPSPAAPISPGATAQLKYPQSFMKGAIIQLANNQFKEVENMTTEDFIECGLLSPTLRIDSSTVVNIEKTPSTGSAKLGFHVGQDNIPITVEAPLEHPFFVYKQGWSSCSPERSSQRYGLNCHKLKVGDVCISLTDKPQSVKSNGQKESNFTVPTKNVSSPMTDKSKASVNISSETKEMTSHAFRLPVSIGLEKLTTSSTEKSINKPETKESPKKRKRRWSAPDNLSQNDDINS